MAKKTVSKKDQKTTFSIPSYLAHFIAVLLYLILTAMYFYPQLDGKIIMQGDILGWQGMAKEAMDYYEQTGEVALWSNSMFGGMPTYQTNNLQPGNYLQFILKAAGLFLSRPIGVFLGGAVLCYFMLLIMGVRPIVSWLGGFAFAFTTYHPILFEAGHTSKLLSITTFPVVIAGMYLVFKKNYAWGGLLFAAGMGLAMFANHVQMTYFLGIAMAFYFLAEMYQAAKTAEVSHVGKSILVLGIALLLGLGSSAGKLWTTYEYGKETMRGEPILQSNNQESSSSATNGLDWEYAMQWSQGGLELFTFIIPGVSGGSSNEKIGSDSNTRKSLASRGVNLPSDFGLPLYWGKLPFTSGPVYVGVLICLFFLMGMIAERGPLKWWILAGVIFTLLFSMGKHFEGFNRILFDHLPLLNKFRSPNSVTAVTPILMIILGTVHLKHIFDGSIENERVNKALIIAGGVIAAVCLYFGLIGPGTFDFNAPGDTQLAQSGFPMDAIKADRSALMSGDAYRSLFILIIGLGCIKLFLMDKVSMMTAGILLAAVTVGDLWTINKRYLSHGDFVNKRAYTEHFAPRPVDEQILKDTDLSYRVHDMSINSFNSSFASYFHKTIGGYHAAKLQRYQDVIERYISRNEMNVLNMLNTRYFIFKPDEQSDAMVQKNPEALGNAWFVSELKMVTSSQEEINAIGAEDFDPGSRAIVHEEFKESLSGLSFSGEGKMELTAYSPNKLTYKVETNQNQFAVFSEVWYGPNKGWKVWVDGQQSEHIRVNYLLRGMHVPAGTKEIVFSFEPKSHIIGEKIARASSGLIMLSLIGMIAMYFVNRRNKSSIPRA